MDFQLLSTLLDLHKSLEKKAYQIGNALSFQGEITLFDNELEAITDCIASYIGLPKKEICFRENSKEYELYFDFLDMIGCVNCEPIYNLLWDYSYNRITKEDVLNALEELHLFYEELENSIVPSL